MYCGLDFGTSNTLCAVEGKNGRAEFAQVDGDERDIPSAAFYPLDRLDAPVYGRTALDLYVKGADGRLLRSFKRLLGTKFFASGTMLSSRKKLKFEQLFIDFIKHVKLQTESYVGQELSHVVIGRPVRFSSRDLDHKSGEVDLTKIANSIGFKHVEFQYEPIAAAFAHEHKLTQEQLAIVVDLGGGTSDFSVLRLGPKRKDINDRSQDILANYGVALGGTDFDSALSVGQVMKYFGYKSTYGPKNLAVPNWPYNSASDWNRIAIELYLRKTFLAFKNLLSEAKEPEKLHLFLKLIEHRRAHHLLKEVETAKIALSSGEFSRVCPDFVEQGLEIPISREDFEKQTQQHIDTLYATAQEALDLAQTQAQDIELVIMTGGASAMPHVQQAFLNFFPEAEIRAENRMGSVCEGLLYDARRKFGYAKI